MANKKNDATLLYVVAMLIYSSIGIFRRYIPISSVALALARGLIGGIFLLLWLPATGGSLKLGISKKKRLMLFVTGIFLGGNWILLFEAYKYTSVAVATLCYYMEPTILILVSPLIFKEKLTAKKLLCALVSLVGMVLVSGVADGGIAGGDNLKGIAFGIGAAALYTIVVILNKKNPVENAGGKTMLQLFSSSAVLLPYLLLTEGVQGFRLEGMSIVMLLIVGIVHTGIAYVLYFGSIQKMPSHTVAVLSYIDPVGAIVLAWLILSEPMSTTEIIGAVMILGAAMFSETRRK